MNRYSARDLRFIAAVWLMAARTYFPRKKSS